MQLPQKLTSLVVFGITGSGKSTLANTITGTEAFKESIHLQSETDITTGMLGKFDNESVFVIDTPGLQDGRGTDSQHLIQMTQYVKSITSVQAFVFVINYNNYRFDASVIRLFQLMASMYPGKKWYHHIAIVWTNYYDALPQNIRNLCKDRKNESMQIIKEKIIPDATDDELKSIPQYFIDSIEARNSNSDHLKQLGYLLAWIAQLQPLNETLGEIQQVKKDIKKEEIETETRTIRNDIEDNILIIETATFERIKKTMYSGDVFYTDWKEKEGTRKKDKKVLTPPPPNVQLDYRENEKIIGERKQIDGVRNGREYGRIMQKKRKIKERRFIKSFSDGKIEETQWEPISDMEEEIQISTFGNDVVVQEKSSSNDKSNSLEMILAIPKVFSETFSAIKSLFS